MKKIGQVPADFMKLAKLIRAYINYKNLRISLEELIRKFCKWDDSKVNLICDDEFSLKNLQNSLYKTSWNSYVLNICLHIRKNGSLLAPVGDATVKNL